MAATHARRHPQSTESYKRQFRAVRAHDTSAELPGLHLPALVIHGETDELIRLPDGVRLAGGISGAQFRVYPHTGHMPHIERREEFLTDLRGFLEEHTR
ncbi:alpha/beta hydrolase [Deinococcus sp. KNUC1210]|uniref:alpha/beta fold hydrolase n=1 Tax=Deinococcus sp. KNUC1210 TaxID=2917691 RepID=UPI001EF081DD|nr:alpha/beta hydrolase [Deinococcus sp. KNUC1210]ULH15169.1 alpha/beta hydrolase [Deinococcus sp. KNUC1210]